MATTNKMPWHASPLNMLLQQTRQKSKMKTNKSAQKRFRVRGNGTLVRYVFFALQKCHTS